MVGFTHVIPGTVGASLVEVDLGVSAVFGGFPKLCKWIAEQWVAERMVDALDSIVASAWTWMAIHPLESMGLTASVTLIACAIETKISEQRSRASAGQVGKPMVTVRTGTEGKPSQQFLQSHKIEQYPPLELRQGMTHDGLVVWLVNNTSEVIRECSLSLGTLHHRPQKSAAFRPGHSSKLDLIPPHDLQPGQESSMVPLATLISGGKKLQVDRVLQAGIWRAKFNVIQGVGDGDGKVRHELRFFRWEPGVNPEFVPDPDVDRPIFDNQ